MKNGRRPACFPNVGGHIIDPPPNCGWKKFGAEGGVWTDLSLCGRSCDKQCDRFREWDKLTAEERERDALSRGIKPVKKHYDKF